MDQEATKRPLLAIKIVHTIVWVFFVVCIVAIPLKTARGALHDALLFAAIVFVEVLVLMVNRWRCPLTPVAARYTQNRRDNFDIFLPEWLARHNKVVFGSLYVLGLLYLVAMWILR